jgi:predicted nucleic acid-binding protein
VTVIIDASALSSYILEEDDIEQIRSLLIRGVLGTELVITETCNSILTAVRRKRISEESAQKALEVLISFVDTNIKILKQDGSLLSEAYQNARENGWAIYDNIYIMLAKKLGGSLASRDPKQIEVAKKSGVKVITV